MVKAIVEIEEGANKVLNIVKAQYDLKDKSEAINEMARQYREITRVGHTTRIHSEVEKGTEGIYSQDRKRQGLQKEIRSEGITEYLLETRTHVSEDIQETGEEEPTADGGNRRKD